MKTVIRKESRLISVIKKHVRKANSRLEISGGGNVRLIKAEEKEQN